MNYCEGPTNVLVDDLSRCYRLPSNDELAIATYLVPLTDTNTIDKIEDYLLEDIWTIDQIFLELKCAAIQDVGVNKMLDSYVNFRDENVLGSNPFNFKHIADEQQTENKLQILTAKVFCYWWYICQNYWRLQ